MQFSVITMTPRFVGMGFICLQRIQSVYSKSHQQSDIHCEYWYQLSLEKYKTK